MRVNLEDYYIISSICVGNNLVITFQHSLDIHNRLVLECKEVVGFIDHRNAGSTMILRIDEGGGSYPNDLSLRLQRPEISNYPEAFLFTSTPIPLSNKTKTNTGSENRPLQSTQNKILGTQKINIPARNNQANDLR
jgi:hypothetical protein